MAIPLRVLIVEDSEDDLKLLVRELKRSGYDVTFERVETPGAMTAALAGGPWDIVLSDFSLPHFSAPAALRVVNESGIDLPFIIVSGTVGEEVAVNAMKAGAHDYVMKGRLTRLAPAIDRELREAERRREHKQVQSQLFQSQKMEAIGQLAGGVAHDFNNLLTVINGYSQMMLERKIPDDPDRKCLEEIFKAGERAAALTRQLLAFSRRQVLTLRVLDLNAIIAGMHTMLRRLIGEDIDLVSVPARDLGNVKVDSGQMEQVILNLALNARDAMPKGGKLTIETANVDLDESYTPKHATVKPGPHVMLAVSDTGIGLDPETQNHIFEPFFTTKEQGKGTGLGLSTVYGIVKQSGGSIWVYSERGRGATFKIYLPRVDEPAKINEPAEAPPELSEATETILLVEDDASVRMLVRQTLEMKGYRVLEAENGVEALWVSEQRTETIHLMVTDVIMPEIGGRILAEQLAVKRPEMKVLYMSGYTDDAVIRHGVLELNSAFIQKPFGPDALARKVREVLDAPGHKTR
jgi:signal transduction histidine kinase